jgi:hypothetical protein
MLPNFYEICSVYDLFDDIVSSKAEVPNDRMNYEWERI